MSVLLFEKGRRREAVLLYLKKRKPEEKVPKPSSIRVTAKPTELVADGKSTSTVTVQLLDKEGKPVAASADIEVKLTTTGGKVESEVVKISKGKDTGTTFLLSSKEACTAILSAEEEKLGSASVTLTLKEKKRYCMHCGAKISFAAKRCPECGKAPPAGLDTKACKNCKAVIAVVAKFCAECGASQPEQGG